MSRQRTGKRMTVEHPRRDLRNSAAPSTILNQPAVRIDMDGLLQMLLAIGRALGTALVMIFLFGALLVGVASLILGLFVDLGDEWVMPLIVGWAGLAVVALLLYLDWRSGNL